MADWSTQSDAIQGWIAQNADPLTNAPLEGDLGDLADLERFAEGAVVVALGYPQATRELNLAGDRIVRYLIERCGFRAIALEDSPAAAASVEGYIRCDGDIEATLKHLFSPTRMPDFARLLRWIKQSGPPQFSVIGADAGATVALNADEVICKNLIDHHTQTGEKIIYLGGLAHSVSGGPVTSYYPPSPHSPSTGYTAGHYLRDQLRGKFRNIAMVFHHGSGSQPIPAPPETFVEHVLGGKAIHERYFLDLHATPCPEPVRSWLNSPAATRVIGPYFDADNQAEYRMTGGALSEWCDAVVYYHEVTPINVPGT